MGKEINLSKVSAVAFGCTLFFSVTLCATEESSAESYSEVALEKGANTESVEQSSRSDRGLIAGGSRSSEEKLDDTMKEHHQKHQHAHDKMKEGHDKMNKEYEQEKERKCPDGKCGHNSKMENEEGKPWWDK